MGSDSARPRPERPRVVGTDRAITAEKATAAAVAFLGQPISDWIPNILTSSSSTRLKGESVPVRGRRSTSISSPAQNSAWRIFSDSGSSR